jgi:hypothetical protein
MSAQAARLADILSVIGGRASGKYRLRGQPEVLERVPAGERAVAYWAPSGHMRAAFTLV